MLIFQKINHILINPLKSIIMKYLIVVFSLLMVSLFCLRCKHIPAQPLTPIDTTPQIENDCEIHYNPNIPISATQEPDNKLIQYYTPCFNPNNEQECVFILQDMFKFKLMNLNLSTNSYKTLYIENNGLIQYPVWHKNNWILFLRVNQIMKIKSNGDSLTQITQNGIHRYPIWNNKGDKIMYCDDDTTWSIDANGEQKQKLFDKPYSLSAINNAGDLALGWTNNSIAFSTFENPNVNKIYSNSTLDHFGIGGMAWLPNNTELLISTNHGGLYQLNVETEIFTQLKDSCAAKYTLDISTSPVGDKILMQKTVFSIDSMNRLWMDSKIFLMDIYGKYEKEIIY